MFKKNEAVDFNNAETIIGPSVKVEGDFVGQGDLVIEGSVKGNVKTNGNLRIGAQAKVTATIEAANAIISGEVHGNITVTGDLELTESAKVTGDVAAQTIAIARGATLNGKCDMSGGKNLAATTKDNTENKDALKN